MSKSKKKQRARARAQEELQAVVPAAPQPENDDFDEPDDGPSLALPEHHPTPVDQALFDRVVAAAIHAGQMREEGDRLVYLYNADTLALKYTEPGEGEGELARVMVAAFRQGVVYQVEGDRQLVYRPGDWEAQLAAVLEAPPPDEDEHDDEGDDPA